MVNKRNVACIALRIEAEILFISPAAFARGIKRLQQKA
jgi:hypothetical protein